MSQTRIFTTSKNKRSKGSGGGSNRGVPGVGQPNISISLQLSSSEPVQPHQSIPDVPTTASEQLSQFHEQQELAKQFGRDAKLELLFAEFALQKSSLAKVQADLVMEQQFTRQQKVALDTVTLSLHEKDKVHSASLNAVTLLLHEKDKAHSAALTQHKQQTLATFAKKDKRINMLIDQIRVLNEGSDLTNRNQEEINDWFISLPHNKDSPTLTKIQLRIILEITLKRLAVAVDLKCTPMNAALKFRESLGTGEWPELTQATILTEEQYERLDQARLHKLHEKLNAKAISRDPGIVALKACHEGMRLIAQYFSPIRRNGDRVAHELPPDITYKALVDIINMEAAALDEDERTGMESLARYIRHVVVTPDT